MAERLSLAPGCSFDAAVSGVRGIACESRAEHQSSSSGVEECTELADEDPRDEVKTALAAETEVAVAKWRARAQGS
jgi:hypothetical protein